MQMQRPNLQEKVNDYFGSSSAYWKDVYSDGKLLSTIYRARRKTILEWASSLHLPKDARILEIGCGAGFITVALARNGYTVDAIDSVGAMLQMTHAKAVHNGVCDQVRLHLADVHALPFKAGTFDLVIAVGVIPWLHSEQVAVLEMQRVLKTGGHLLLTADNSARLNRVMDPRSSPLLRPPRLVLKYLLRAFGLRSGDSDVLPKLHYPRQVNRLMKDCNLRNVKCCTVGFGPFTIFGRAVLNDPAAVKLHDRLQNLAKKNSFVFRRAGSHYLVLAHKG
jgi:ubiquinone/menaquinone biosynthesis C-methylase UbiE